MHGNWHVVRYDRLNKNKPKFATKQAITKTSSAQKSRRKTDYFVQSVMFCVLFNFTVGTLVPQSDINKNVSQ